MAAALRVADAIRVCWETFERTHALPPHVVGAVRRLLRCRTAALGGHMHACDRCGAEVPLYNVRVHCLVPGGAWREETKRWVPCRSRWLFRKDSLADAFRNRYLKRLKSLRRRGRLAYGGRAAPLADEGAWLKLLDDLERVRWIVFPKTVPAGPEKALDYLARYTHKVAIGDHRIKAVAGGEVAYTWRDRDDGNREKTETLPVEDFTRRFVAHILPERFHKVRHYGWMAAGRRDATLAAIREVLGAPAPAPTVREPIVERILRETGVDIRLRPVCRQGRMQPTGRPIAPSATDPP